MKHLKIVNLDVVAAAAESTTNHKRNSNAATCTDNQRKHDQNMQNHAIMDALRTTVCVRNFFSNDPFLKR